MEIESGKVAVWKHAGEAGMQEKIKLVSKYFDISDVSIIYNGKMTYIENRPRKVLRVEAVPTPQGSKDELKKAIQSFRDRDKKR